MLGVYLHLEWRIMRTLALALTFMMTDVVPAPRALSPEDTKNSSRKQMPGVHLHL